MSIAAVLLAVIVLAVIEKFWAPAALNALVFRGSCDRAMAEPGELVTWTGTVENHFRLAVPFVRLREHFPIQAQAAGKPNWIRSHCHKGIQRWYVEERMALGAGRRCSRSVQLRFSQRGAYQIGSYQLSAGDLLGFREADRTGQSQSIVIIPQRSQSRKAAEALGGFLGDVSVRRFILEDPVLTTGFRDYTGREPMKSISWTRSAAAGQLQVKQYDYTAEQNVVVLLNVEGGTPEELEECFRLMRSACEQLERRKIPFGIRTNGILPGPVGKIFTLADGLGSRHINTILYALGQADYTCFQSFRSLVRQAVLHRKNNESYIVITPSLTAPVQGVLRTLEAAAGSAVCVLVGNTEAQA